MSKHLGGTTEESTGSSSSEEESTGSSSSEEESW